MAWREHYESAPLPDERPASPAYPDRLNLVMAGAGSLSAKPVEDAASASEVLLPFSERQELARRLHATLEHSDPTLGGTDDWDELSDRERTLYLAVAGRLLGFYLLKRPATTV